MSETVEIKAEVTPVEPVKTIADWSDLEVKAAIYDESVRMAVAQQRFNQLQAELARRNGQKS